MEFWPIQLTEEVLNSLDGKRCFPRCLRECLNGPDPPGSLPQVKTQGGTNLAWMPPWRFDGFLDHYWSIEKPARRFCCQQASVDSVQKGFSLP